RGGAAVRLRPNHPRPAPLCKRLRPGRRRLDRLPDQDRRRGQGRENGQHVERLHLLPGQVGMSTHLAERPTITDRVAKWIRWLCVPIVLFWVAVAALTNALVPQLEAVGEVHNVALSSPESPSLTAVSPIR